MLFHSSALHAHAEYIDIGLRITHLLYPLVDAGIVSFSAPPSRSLKMRKIMIGLENSIQLLRKFCGQESTGECMSPFPCPAARLTEN